LHHGFSKETAWKGKQNASTLKCNFQIIFEFFKQYFSSSRRFEWQFVGKWALKFSLPFP
jgi:hypothetical protein